MMMILLSDEVFQNRGFSGGLASDDGDLGQVDDHRDAQLGEGILHPIDNRNEDLHSSIARRHPEDLNRQRHSRRH